MNTLDYLAKNHKISSKSHMPVEIPNVGRANLTTWLSDLNFKTGVEVGPGAGIYSEVLCKTNPNMKLYIVNLKKTVNGFHKRMNKYSNFEIIKNSSIGAARNFRDNTLDFIYLNGNLKNPYITDDITEWFKKLKPGGILAGHNYIKLRNNASDIITATNRYAKDYNLESFFILGAQAKVPGELRDKKRSWMFVKNPNSTLGHIVDKFNVDLNSKSPIHILCNRYTTLPELFKELGFKVGVEIGVLEGAYSEVLCQSNPDLKLYSIDAWSYYPVYKNFRRQKHHNFAYEIAKKRLSAYPNNKIIRKWSVEAASEFEDEALDFVYIDADHSFAAVTKDIDTWVKKVRKGGIICGHDFSTSRNKQFGHVKNVVCAWTEAYGIHPLFGLDNPPRFRENSWMWVKE